MEAFRLPSDVLSQAYASSACLVTYVLIPVAVYRFVPVPEHNYLGLGWGRSLSYMPFCFVLVTLTMPIAWAIGGTSMINNFYPFYRPIGVRAWLFYEVIYFIRIFAAEFFFRGFLLFRLEHYIGDIAILVATVPYVFIHIHKPLPEVLGSVAAGIFLSALALESCSLWPGLLLHYAAALFIDLSAAAHTLHRL